MAERRSYSGSAVPTTVVSNYSSSATSITIATTTGWPDGSGGPFFVQNDSEVIKCVGRSGSVLSVQTTPLSGRGWGGTTAASHVAGSAITHVFTSTDADDANKHYADGTTDDHAQYLNIARHDTSTRHSAANLPLGGTPTNSAPGDVAASGSAANIARSDHKHGRESGSSGAATIVTSSTHPSSPTSGQIIVESDTGRLFAWDGAIWAPLVSYDSTYYVNATFAGSLAVASGTTVYLNWASATTSNPFIATPSTTFTIPSGGAGLYSISCTAQWEIQIGELHAIYLEVGATTYTAVGTGSWLDSMSAIQQLAAGSTIKAKVFQNNASSKNIISAEMHINRLALI